MKTRLWVALSAYAVLALIATFTHDGILRTALWIFFLWLAIKTLAASKDTDDDR